MKEAGSLSSQRATFQITLRFLGRMHKRDTVFDTVFTAANIYQAIGRFSDSQRGGPGTDNWDACQRMTFQ